MFFLQLNHKKLLSNINPILMVALVYGLVLLRTTADPLVPSMFRWWDILLPFSVYFGQRRSLVEGLFLCLLCSHLYSLASAAPIGIFVMFHLIVFVAARAISLVMYADHMVPVFLLMAGLGILGRFILFLIAIGFGHRPLLLGGFSGFLGVVVVNSLLGTAIYTLIDRIDKWTFKMPRSRLEVR